MKPRPLFWIVGWILALLGAFALRFVALTGRDQADYVHNLLEPIILLGDQVDIIRLNIGELPKDLNGVVMWARNEPPQSGYFTHAPVRDNWGHPVRYQRQAGDRYELRSAGADGIMGTKDDLVVLKEGNSTRIQLPGNLPRSHAYEVDCIPVGTELPYLATGKDHGVVTIPMSKDVTNDMTQ